MSESKDAQTLQALRDAGSDLSLPHELDHFFYFTAEASARAAWEDLADDFTLGGLKELEGVWCLELHQRMVPALEAVEATTARLREIADRHGGEYDGWGTEVEP